MSGERDGRRPDGGTDAGERDRVRVCPAAELDPGDRRLVAVDGREVGVFNVAGDYYALVNDCAHEGGPVCEGTVRRQLEASYEGPGERVRERLTDRPAVACPWHGWEYDLETGRHLGESGVRLPTYEVAVEDGVVYLLA